MKVRDVMSEQPFWVTPEDDVVSVAICMSEHALGALPVCEDGRLVGMIARGDLGSSLRRGSPGTSSSPVLSLRAGNRR